MRKQHFLKHPLYKKILLYSCDHHHLRRSLTLRAHFHNGYKSSLNIFSALLLKHVCTHPQ